MKFKVKARQIKNGKAQYISLVDNPASRIPIKVLKQDKPDGETKPMSLHINNLFKKQASVTPLLVAVVCRKGTEDSTKALLEKCDLIVDDMEEVEGTIVFKQEAFDTDDATGFQLNEDIAVVVTGVLQKFSTYTDSVLFEENLATNGFFPSIRMAQDSLMETIYNVYYSRDSKEEAVPLVKNAVKDFGTFVNAMLDNMPETVTKVAHEVSLLKVVNNDPHPEEDEEEAAEAAEAVATAEAASAKVRADKDKKAKTPTKVVDGEAEVPHDDSKSPGAAEAAAEEEEEVVDPDADPEADPEADPDADPDAVQKSTLLSDIGSLMDRKLAPVLTRLDEVETVAKDAESKSAGLSKTVLGTEDDDDEDSFRNPVQKSAPVGSDEFWAGTLTGLNLDRRH